MVKDEIVEGLKVALSKGQSLQSAMMSFYNAGYSKEEIEEAAVLLHAPQVPSTQSESQPQVKSSQPINQNPQPERITKPLKQPVKVIQRVSEYREEPSKTGTTVTIILVSLLLILLGLLAVIFLFKDEILTLLNKLFGL